MGKLRLGLNAILGTVLLFAVFQADLSQARSCGSVFSNADYASAQVPLLEHKQLKIVNWNLLTFKINPQAIENKKKENRGRNFYNTHERQSFTKSQEEIIEFQKTFQSLDGDVYIFQEAIGASLKYFAKKYLDDKYDVVLEKSKRDTEMQIAFLVKKSLNVTAEVESYEHVMWENTLVHPAVKVPIFHKDLPALYLRQKDNGNTGAKQDPHLIIVGTHFKSKRNSFGDPQSVHQRTVQIQKAAQIIKDITERYQNVPLMLTGDFNTDIGTSKEVDPLRFLLKDSLELTGKNPMDRVTHTYKNHGSQLDGQMVNPALAKKLLNSFVFVFGRRGLMVNGNLAVKMDFSVENPSDHNPVVSTYDMTK